MEMMRWIIPTLEGLKELDKPNHEAGRMKYVLGPELSNAHGSLGKTAVDAVEHVLHDKGPELRKLRAEVRGNIDQ